LSDLPFRSYKALNIPQNGLHTYILASRTLALAKARASVENEKSKGTFFPRTFKVEEKKVSLFF